ncbi:MAG TPA: NAD(P)-dependent oxidoreductase [Candidatus Cybelea sp.]|nr:NAD(P)-dependent oxidoreductase [Candidatus Cybelea sp.]
MSRKPFFPVSLNLEGRACVVIGAADDPEAIAKAAALEESGARVRRICDVAELRDPDVIDAFFVISTPGDAALSARLRELADRHRFLLCCIDQPRFGFVAMAAIAKAGPVRIAISTAGLAPRVGKVLKNALQRALDERFAQFIEILAQRRERVRAEHPAPESSQVRRTAMIEAARGFRVDVRFEYPAWFEQRDGER